MGPWSQSNPTRNPFYRSIVNLLGTVRSIQGEEGDRIWNLIKKIIILKKLNLDWQWVYEKGSTMGISPQMKKIRYIVREQQDIFVTQCVIRGQEP